MIIAIHQPQFLPWLGYFHKMSVSDGFCLLDTVQYKKNEWQNRNRIRTATGWQWLTVPVSFRFPEMINEVRINNSVNWKRKHIQALSTNYRKATFFSEIMPFLEEAYSKEWHSLSELNISVIIEMRNYLGLGDKEITVASQMGNLSEEPTERLIDICKLMGADTYLSGPDGPNYMDMDAFARNGIQVVVQEFHHPLYRQCFDGFESHMSIIDLLFNFGKNSYDILRDS
jgi:hypothetical protein